MVICSPLQRRLLTLLILVCELQLFILIANAQVSGPSYCPNTTTYNPNSTYQANLNRLLTKLSSTKTLFLNETEGNVAPDVVYGLVLCRGDLTIEACRECARAATTEVINRCPKEKESVIWYDECMLRYNNISFFGKMDTFPAYYVYNLNNVSDPNRFDQILGEIMNKLIIRASETESPGSLRGFAREDVPYTSVLRLFNLVQCTPDLSELGCSQCLHTALGNRPAGKQSVKGFYASCIIRYETFPFYNNDVAPSPSPPSLAPPPPPPPPPLTAQVPDKGSGGNGGLATGVIICIVVAVIISVVLFIVVFCILRRKAKKQQNVIINATEGVDSNAISAPQSLQYDLNNVKAATDNFSVANKIGEGGFGEVFKVELTNLIVIYFWYNDNLVCRPVMIHVQGSLNGQQIAVKRLSKSSGQGEQEFKNEVLVVAKLQHRNLVRLLGYCLDEGEKILIYEFVPNKSLDFILFDEKMKQSLHWSRRYKIIGGVARGMLYLHEDSRLRIIHRDLKASNVLLDSDMNAKIADFGMARIVGADESQINTSRVVGTFGYMPPEYALHGQFSIKSDIFSFGVLVLEIISGKKNFSFHQSGNSEDLKSYAWKLWRDNRPLDLVDPALGDNFARNEVIRCIHIGLLCVQAEAEDRPTMAAVVLMLSSYSVTLPLPHEPAFFLHSRTTSIPNRPDSSQSSNKSLSLSANDEPITEMYPR